MELLEKMIACECRGLDSVTWEAFPILFQAVFLQLLIWTMYVLVEWNKQGLPGNCWKKKAGRKIKGGIRGVRNWNEGELQRHVDGWHRIILPCLRIWEFLGKGRGGKTEVTGACRVWKGSESAENQVSQCEAWEGQEQEHWKVLQMTGDGRGRRHVWEAEVAE